MPQRTSATGSELFIVDNSDADWKVLRYLHDWCQISKAIDIATGYLEIGALLGLIRTQFLKRFESSAHSFEASCHTLLDKLLAWITKHSQTASEKRNLERWTTRHGELVGYVHHRQTTLFGDEEVEDEDLVSSPGSLRTTPTKHPSAAGLLTGTSCHRRSWTTCSACTAAYRTRPCASARPSALRGRSS